MDETVKILYEDRELIVCHKPAGLPVQSARVGQKDMVSILNNYLAQARTPIYVVHRLDQPVEGVLVFAKTKRAAAELSRQVSDGTMKKIYRAVCCVEGDESRTAKRLAERAGIKEQNQDFRLEPGRTCRLVDYLVRDGRTNTSSVVEIGNQNKSNAKRAELIFRVVERWEKYLLVEIELKTGRHHQIRVQMAHAGLPLYGDQKYNTHWREFLVDGEWGSEGWKQEKTPNETQTEKQNGERTRLALCATTLTFVHPTTGREMTFGTESTTSKNFFLF